MIIINRIHFHGFAAPNNDMKLDLIYNMQAEEELEIERTTIKRRIKLSLEILWDDEFSWILSQIDDQRENNGQKHFIHSLLFNYNDNKAR